MILAILGYDAKETNMNPALSHSQDSQESLAEKHTISYPQKEFLKLGGEREG